MDFVFKENHRNISDEELINDLKKTAENLHINELSKDIYDENGEYHSSTICKRFGCWSNALELADLKMGKNYRKKISRDDLIKDLQNVVQRLNLKTITTSLYKQQGAYGIRPFLRVFGSWDNALKAANLEETGYNYTITDEDLFNDIENMWTLKGSQPTTSDVRKGLSKYGLNTFCRRFGGWNNALKAFISYINMDDYIEVDKTPKEANEKKLEQFNSRKTNRDINLRLRFRILQRDNFKCCICGAAPANDPTVVLHVDHIIPWSKGGETVEENLQTLCSKCNLGKSDII